MLYGSARSLQSKMRLSEVKSSEECDKVAGSHQGFGQQENTSVPFWLANKMKHRVADR